METERERELHIPRQTLFFFFFEYFETVIDSHAVVRKQIDTLFPHWQYLAKQQLNITTETLTLYRQHADNLHHHKDHSWCSVFIFWPCLTVHGIPVPHQGSSLWPPQQEHRVPTTRQPGKSLVFFMLLFYSHTHNPSAHTPRQILFWGPLNQMYPYKESYKDNINCNEQQVLRIWNMLTS